MQKIKTKEDLEKSKRKTNYIIGFVLIFLMVFSTAGYALYNTSGDSSNYGEDQGSDGAQFNGQYWVLNYQNQPFYFSFNEEEIKDVEVSITQNIASYNGQTLYVDTKNEAILRELGINLGSFVSRIQQACYGPCEEDFPEKICEDNLIVYEESETNRVYQAENCIFIEGDLRAVDAFLYNLIGIV